MRDRSPCNLAANEVKWCVVASTYDGTILMHFSLCRWNSHSSLGNQHDGTPYKANPGDHVTYDCKFNQ